jgi:hypothetical protein
MKEESELIAVIVLFIVIGVPVFVWLVTKIEDYMVYKEHKRNACKKKKKKL